MIGKPFGMTRSAFRSVVVIAALGVLGAAPGCTRPRSDTLIDETLTVRAGELKGVMFVIDTTRMRNVVVEGSFHGRDNHDIIAMIMEESEYVNWKQRLQASALYTSAQKNVGAFRVDLRRSGRYYLVFTNHFSLFADKTIRARAALRYEKIFF